MVRAVCLIPGASEFGYDDLAVTQDLGLGATPSGEPPPAADNERCRQPPSTRCRRFVRTSKRVSLVVELVRRRSARRRMRDRAARRTAPRSRTTGPTWSVAGLDARSAQPSRRSDGAPAYGGTPSDDSVIRLIRDLKERGLEVVLYPFVMMDVPVGNGLPDPYGGTGPAGLSLARAHHLHPAPGRRRIAGRHGCGGGAGRAHSSTRRDGAFAGSSLHYAALAKEAGGVAGFIRRQRDSSALTRVRVRIRRLSGGRAADGACRRRARDPRRRHRTSSMRRTGPNTAHMCATAATRCAFRSIRFCASSAIDAVGIDFYPPISDWRDGPDHADLAIARSVNDVDYLRGRIGGGEAFDWYYADAAARSAQTRTPITDGAHGKPWVFRPKDIVSLVVERACGAPRRRRDPHRPPGMPQSKPIWLTEIGVPAVDKGANGPNVFPDPKSSESAYPPFSRGVRDDLMQARGLEAILSRFDPALSGFQAGLQPRLGRLWPTHDRSRQYVRLGLGCAAVSGLSGFYLGVGGRRQLGNRALDHGQDRGRGARPADRCDPAGFRRRPMPDRSRSTGSSTATWSTDRCRHAEPWSH